MPTTTVVAEGVSYADGPTLNGVRLRRPNAVDESPEAVRNDVVLANGSLRSYASGTRFVASLTWNKLTQEEVTNLRAALSSPFLPYTHIDGVSRVVQWDPPSVTPIAGTDPIRFSVSLSLRDQVAR